MMQWKWREKYDVDMEQGKYSAGNEGVFWNYPHQTEEENIDYVFKFKTVTESPISIEKPDTIEYLPDVGGIQFMILERKQGNEEGVYIRMAKPTSMQT